MILRLSEHQEEPRFFIPMVRQKLMDYRGPGFSIHLLSVSAQLSNFILADTPSRFQQY